MICLGFFEDVIYILFLDKKITTRDTALQTVEKNKNKVLQLIEEDIDKSSKVQNDFVEILLCVVQ